MPGSDRRALLHWCNSARIGLPFGSLCPDRPRRGLFLSFPAFSRRSSSFPAVRLQIALYFLVFAFFSKNAAFPCGALCFSCFSCVLHISKKGVFFLTFPLFAGRGVWQQFPGIPLPVGVSCLLAPLPVWVILHPPYCVRACYISLCGRSLACRGARANRGVCRSPVSLPLCSWKCLPGSSNTHKQALQEYPQAFRRGLPFVMLLPFFLLCSFLLCFPAFPL